MSGKSARKRRKKLAGDKELARWDAFVEGLAVIFHQSPKQRDEVSRMVRESPEARNRLADWAIGQIPHLSYTNRAMLLGMLHRLDDPDESRG